MKRVIEELNTAELRFFVWYLKVILLHERAGIFWRHKMDAARGAGRGLWKYPERVKLTLKVRRIVFHVWISVQTQAVNNE